MAYNRNASASIANATQAAVRNNEGGSFGPSIISFPSGFKAFKLDPQRANQEQFINIIPWAIETDKHPRVALGEARVGDNDFVLDVWTHSIDGVLKGTTLCMSKTFQRACPFCEEMTAQSGQAPRASRRNVFWIQECDRNGNPIGDGQPKLFNTSHFAFTKALLEEADIQGKSQGMQGPIPFSDPDNGFVVGFRYRMESSGGAIKYAALSRVDFYKRQNPLPDSLLNSVPALDTLLRLPTQDEVRAALYGRGSTPAAPEAPAGNAYAPAAEESF